MAIAESALRHFGIKGLTRLSVRGGGVIGSAIGSGIGIGYGLYQDYAMSIVPIKPSRQFQRPNVGVDLTGENAQNGRSYNEHQALRSSYSTQYYKRRYKQSYNRKRRGGACCCQCVRCR